MAGGGDESHRVTVVYRAALGRGPEPAEQGEAAEFLASYRSESKALGKGDAERGALAALARVLFGSNEFLTAD